MATKRMRAYRHPVPSVEAARRILRAIAQRRALGQAWDVHEFTQQPKTLALVQAQLSQEECHAH